ncbi:MAG TPA: hypothetical protein PLH64_02585 [Anaerolineaceae bacterium]|nr:hypothetical protein [Anaerolineaceae bacterium]
MRDLTFLNHLRKLVRIAVFVILLAITGMLSSCNLLTSAPPPAGKDTYGNTPSQAVTIASNNPLAQLTPGQTVVPTLTETPEATNTENPKSASTAEVIDEPLDLNSIINLTNISLTNKAYLEVALSVGAEMFRNREICSDEVMQESGFFFSPPGDSTNNTNVPHLGLLVGRDFYVDFQGCVLAGFLKEVEGKDGQMVEHLFLAIGFEKRPSQDRSITLFSIPLEELLAAKKKFLVHYVHSKEFNFVGVSPYFLASREEVLKFWEKMLGKPVTFQLDFYEAQPFSAQDIEYLKSQGTDPVLLYEIAKTKNLSIKLNQDLAATAYCVDNGVKEFDICKIRGENPPIEISSLSDAILLMDGRPLPMAYYVMVRGAGLEY